MENNIFLELFADVIDKKNIQQNVPMSQYTSMRVGGSADLLVTPENRKQLADMVIKSTEHGIPFYIIGNGTNLIVRDKGIRGVVFRLTGAFDHVSLHQEDVLEAEAGLALSAVADFALSHALTGFEFAAGIPGALGGAIVMNAGAYGGEMRDVVVETECMDLHGNIYYITGEQHGFGYRTSRIQKEGLIVLSSKIALKRGNTDKIRAMMDELWSKRQDKQPLEFPSAGSVFKRPKDHFAGKLIEDCGLRGSRIGGAQVSEKHCGFIVNTGDATAGDVLSLIELIQQKVKQNCGVDLQTEVRILGEV